MDENQKFILDLKRIKNDHLRKVKHKKTSQTQYYEICDALPELFEAIFEVQNVITLNPLTNDF